jgi:hypothetical protein
VFERLRSFGLMAKRFDGICDVFSAVAFLVAALVVLIELIGFI